MHQPRQQHHGPHYQCVRKNLGQDYLLDTPNNQRLTTAAVSCCKDTFNIGVVFLTRGQQRTRETATNLGRCLNVGPGIGLELERVDDLGLRSQETKGKEDKLSREELLGAWDLFHLPSSTAVFCPLDAN